MPKAPDREPRPQRGLALPIAGALALKAAALAIIYLMFFAAPAAAPPADRVAAGILGLR